MFRVLAITAISGLLSAIVVVDASAQQRSRDGRGAQEAINPQCSKMSNARGCTCALETGGTITADGRWRYTNAPNYSNCMQQKGWM